MQATRTSPEPGQGEEAELQEGAENAKLEKAEKKYLRVGSQAFYGDCKAGYGPRQGTFVRDGFGRQLNTAVTPAGYKILSGRNPKDLRRVIEQGGTPAYETSIMASYEGNWEDDMMSGQGVYSWSDGSSYDGAFVNGQMHGPGRFKWPDGSTYEGTWHSGQMSGHGRLDYKFDGFVWQGRFQRDAYQKHTDGQWVDVWKQTREIERTQILTEQPCSPAVKRCACGELNSSQPEIRCQQIDELQKRIFSAQTQGYTPFIIAEESLKHCALKCLSLANLAVHPTQSVSVQMAAIAKRRKQDYNGMFYNAIQKSLLTGTLFTLVFEDDDDGCSLSSKEDDCWFDRQPSLAQPTKPLPEQWQLKHFYHPNMFPPEILHPMLFNGRLMSKLFLPERLREDSMETIQSPAVGSSPEPGSSTVEQGESTTVEEAEPPPVEGMTPAEAAKAAAAKAKDGCVGLTGHVFELPNIADPRTVGLRMVHHLRPAIVARSCLPVGISDDEVCARVVERFKAHVPMHRTMLILLTHDSTVEPDL